METGVDMTVMMECTFETNVRTKEGKRKQADKWIHAHQSRSAATLLLGIQAACSRLRLVVLDVPALQHAACGGVLVMI